MPTRAMFCGEHSEWNFFTLHYLPENPSPAGIEPRPAGRGRYLVLLANQQAVRLIYKTKCLLRNYHDRTLRPEDGNETIPTRGDLTIVVPVPTAESGVFDISSIN